MIHGPYNSSLFVSLGDAFDHLASSMSEFYSSSEKCSPYSVCSSDKAMSKYAAAKLNDRDWQRYSDTLTSLIHDFIPIAIFRVEILQTIPNGESALAVVRWVFL